MKNKQNKICGIYKLSVDGKLYIGASSNIKKRLSTHKNHVRDGSSHAFNVPLYQEIRKIGWDNVQVEIIEECNKDQLDALENKWMLYYNSFSPNGLNQRTAGMIDFKHSKETIQKIVDTRIRKPIIQLTKDFCIVEEFESLLDAQKKNKKYNVGNISQVILGNRKSCAGYYWVEAK